MAGVQFTVMAVTGPTVTVAVAVLVVSCDEIAVTVTGVAAVTAWAVKTPLTSMLPALAAQVTVVMKLPVPVTVATHSLVCPDCTAVGAQATVMAVMVGVVELPPPQAVMPNSVNEARIRARRRKLVPQETVRVELVYRK
jgi:hypothetical protein